jgi:hypothetical protein
MVGRCNFVSDPIFLHELLKKSVAEMLPPIADDGTWCPKMCKHIFFQKLKHNSMIISFASNDLHPFGNVVNCHKDEKVPIRVREGSHEVDAPNIKEFHNKDWVQQHYIPSSYAPQLLASLIGRTISMGITKNGGPI